jgi:hypothetical protein
MTLGNSSQGALANKSGSILEQLVEGTLSRHGFEVIPFREYTGYEAKYGTELLLKNVPFRTLYDTDGKTEFLLLSATYNLQIRIECKWQQSAGSVDEKLPHLYLSAIEAIPEDNIILLVDGKGFRPGAVEWLRKTAEARRFIPNDKKNKNIVVMDTTEFLTWANNTFR